MKSGGMCFQLILVPLISKAKIGSILSLRNDRVPLELSDYQKRNYQ